MFRDDWRNDNKDRYERDDFSDFGNNRGRDFSQSNRSYESRYDQNSYGDFDRDYEKNFDRGFDRGYERASGGFDRDNGGYDRDVVRRQAPPKRQSRGFFGSFKESFKQPVQKYDEQFSPYHNGSFPSNVVITKPNSYNDVQKLIDTLKHRQPLIVELDSIKDENAQRILDFMSGAVYALSGSLHRISGNTFLLTPEGMSIKVPMDYNSTEKKKK